MTHEILFEWQTRPRSAPDAVLVDWKNGVQRRRVWRLVLQCLEGGGRVEAVNGCEHAGSKNYAA